MQHYPTNTEAAINALCAARVSKRVVHTTLSEERYQFNLKLAASFSQGVRDLSERVKHAHKYSGRK